MKKKFLVFVLMSLMVVSSSLLAGDVNVTGKWDITTQSPRGERAREIEFVQDGEKLTVHMTGRQGETIEAQGYVKGNEIGWEVTRETPRGSFTMTYKGTVDGDTMKGEVSFGEMGSAEWTAARKK